MTIKEARTLTSGRRAYLRRCGIKVPLLPMGARKGYKQSEAHSAKRALARRRGAYFECQECQSKFWRKPYDISRGNNKFCSRECYFKAQIGKSKPNAGQHGRRGALCWNWKGGITSANKLFRGSRLMREWRRSVFSRDNWTCQKCGNRSRKNNYVRIEAHHVKPFAVFPELRLVVDNGLTLCKKCHDKEPKGKEVYLITS